MLIFFTEHVIDLLTGIQDPQFYYTMREVMLPKAVGLETRVICDPKAGLLKRAVFAYKQDAANKAKSDACLAKARVDYESTNRDPLTSFAGR